MSETEQENQPLVSRTTSESTLTKEIQGAAQREVEAAQPEAPLVVAEERILGLEQQKQELTEAKDRHNVRIPYIDRMFNLTVVWLAIVIIFLILQATAKNYFNLSDSVLIAFITSTTVSVIGLFVLAAKWLFQSGKNEKDNNKE